MPAPPLYLDECVHFDLVEALRKRGFSVFAAVQLGMLGRLDVEQLEFASSRGWLILTYNGTDFRRLHRSFRSQSLTHGGIIVFPRRGSYEVRAIRAAMILDWIASMGDYRSRLFNWGQLQRLLEQGFRPPGYSDIEVQLALGRKIP